MVEIPLYCQALNVLSSQPLPSFWIWNFILIRKARVFRAIFSAKLKENVSLSLMWANNVNRRTWDPILTIFIDL